MVEPDGIGMLKCVVLLLDAEELETTACCIWTSLASTSRLEATQRRIFRMGRYGGVGIKIPH